METLECSFHLGTGQDKTLGIHVVHIESCFDAKQERRSLQHQAVPVFVFLCFRVS